jgi:hypothetical protein
MRSRATLRIIGDGLVPDEITSLLGCEPTSVQSKGEVIRGNTGRERIAHIGLWRLRAEERTPEDLNAQIAEILDRLNPDPEAWMSLASRFRMDLFCGLFMGRSNEELNVSPAALLALGSRGIELRLDIYDANYPEDDEGGQGA